MQSIFSWQSFPPEKLLVERFHIPTGFHPGQREIIEQLVQGRRVLAIQCTGWGKSLCYQVASLYYPHLTIIFSPLKALMRDQCQRCNTLCAIPAAIVSSDYSQEKNCMTLEQAIAGKFKILFISPERLANTDWRMYVSRMCISMVVIDEAHCISTWGHDFRPDYRQIVRLLVDLPGDIAVLALTATANKQVEYDILRQMGTDVQVIRGTMQRSNLYVNVVRLDGDWEKLCYLGEVLPHRTDTGIIYTATQSSAEMVAMFLRQRGMKAEHYHAGRDDSVRQDIEQKFMANEYNVICSTNALGMGIDKPDIRFVVHYHIPASPISYYQEMGRAGRDGKVAWCILLYDPADVAIQEHFLQHDKQKEHYYEKVLAQFSLASQGLSENDLLLSTGLPRTVLRIILADLREQHFIRYNPKERTYYAIQGTGQLDFSAHATRQLQKQDELRDMQTYALFDGCYMGYLTEYLGDSDGYHCGNCGYCRKENFAPVIFSENIKNAANHFLDEEYLPYIEKCGNGQHPIHEAGWSLCYHGRSSIGKLVRVSKYEDGGPFALSLVYCAVEVIRARYPIDLIDGVVSMPPSKSGLLVEMFARQVATELGIEYLSVLAKVRPTQPQKDCTNSAQKENNVKGAFAVLSPQIIAGRTLLLVDDIYDSGYTLREAGQTLMQAGARAIYPFTITRTYHADNK